MKFLKALLDLILSFFVEPSYDVDPKTLDMNTEPVEQPVVPPNPRELLVAEARKWLGKDASPENKADKNVACVESVITIIRGLYPDFPKTLSTIELDYYLTNSPHFRYVNTPRDGAIIISPRRAEYGHVGICMTTDIIASNDSRSGLFELNYSLGEWIKEMRNNRGLKIFFYEPI